MTYRTFDGTSQVESVTLGRFSASKEGVSDGSTTQGAVYFSDDVDTGFYSPANDKIALITGGVERLHIDDSGNIGIGTAPGTQFEINGSTPYFTLKNDTHEDTDGGRESKIIFEGEQSGGEITTLAQIQASHDGSSDDEKGDLIFSINDGNDAAAPSEVMRITSDKRIGIGVAQPLADLHIDNAAGGGTIYLTDADSVRKNGIKCDQSDNLEVFADKDDEGGTSNIKFKVDGSEKARILSTGGITFNGDTAAANAINDYEEGTWTPAADGGGTIAGTSITYAGSYTKIGNLVHCHFEATNSAGDIEISSYKTFSGLPFATTSGKSGTGRAMTEDSEIVARQGDIVAAGSTFLINASGSGSGTVSLKANFTYQTDS